MAKVLTDFPMTFRGKRMYPWDRWLDGQIWQLVSGEDFRITPVSFRRLAFAAARKRGIRVKTSRVGDDVVIQACFNNGHEPGSVAQA